MLAVVLRVLTSNFERHGVTFAGTLPVGGVTRVPSSAVTIHFLQNETLSANDNAS